MPSLLQQALACQKVERPPVWLMRQAGRYMPEYRALRSKHSLWKLFHEPELAFQVTLQPIEVLGVDAAILFSDILVVAEALGLSVLFPDTGGPRIDPPIHSAKQVDELPLLPVQEVLSYVFATIRSLKKELAVPLIGFSGAPFTLASYFIDSTSKTAFERTKIWMKEDPASFHRLLEKLTIVVIEYVQEQIKAGVEVVQLFDSWAGILTDKEFSEFSFPYLERIVKAVQTQEVPVIVFCRNSSLRALSLSTLGARCLSLDEHVPLLDLRNQVPRHIAIQGNFAPALLKESPDHIKKVVSLALLQMKDENGWVVNLGHGVTPDIPVENVKTFVDLVKGFS